jgi:predicted amidophosphoribosyltransferase
LNAPLCLCCDAPATTADGYCADCYNAIATPDPLCAECGEPLTSDDLAAGETTCLACAGQELEAEIEQEGPLLAVVRARLRGAGP